MQNDKAYAVKSYSPEEKKEYALQKKKERDEMYSLLNRETLALKDDPEKLRDFFRVQARFNNYTISNAILILSQDKDATSIKDFFDWASREVRINRGAKAIKLLYQRTYETKEGDIRYTYSVKSMFDISETSRKNYIVTPDRKGPEELIELLYSSSPVPRREHENEDAVMEAYTLANEVALKDLQVNEYQKDDMFNVALLSSIMVLGRYGTEPHKELLEKVMEILRDMDERGIRRILSTSKDTSNRIIERMDHEIYRKMVRENRREATAER